MVDIRGSARISGATVELFGIVAEHSNWRDAQHAILTGAELGLDQQ
jgi:hypothetical protein